MRRLATLVLLLGLLASPPAQAWEKVSQITHGTARILEKGEMIIGILTPLGSGVHDRLTLFTHPILNLLLTPNGWGRLALWFEEEMAISLEAGYQQSFLSFQEGEGDYPGYAQFGLSASRLLGRRFQLTGALGYGARFGEETDENRNLLYYRAGADLLAGRQNLLMLRVQGAVELSPAEATRPFVLMVYARDMGRSRFGVGAMVGDVELNIAQGSGVYEKATWPVYPYIDIWWRF